MEEITISKFKATCASVFERVRKTGKAVLVTRFGKPVAEVIPPHKSRKSKRWVGSLAGTGQITGDIVSPASEGHICVTFWTNCTSPKSEASINAEGY